MTGALTWAGTFHGIGARLLREYAEQIALNPAFTIHDREDSADLLNLVRHELGFSRTGGRFPTKGPRLAIYSRCVNAEAPIDVEFPKGHKPSVRRDPRPMKFQLHPPVKIEFQKHRNPLHPLGAP